MESGIDILPPWGATELEGLLLQVKNRGLLDAFFPQERQINAAVVIQGSGANQVNGPNAIHIGPGGIQINGPVLTDSAGRQTVSPKQPSKSIPSEIDLEVLAIVGTVKDATTQDVAVRLGIGIERAKFTWTNLQEQIV